MNTVQRIKAGYRVRLAAAPEDDDTSPRGVANLQSEARRLLEDVGSRLDTLDPVEVKALVKVLRAVSSDSEPDAGKPSDPSSDVAARRLSARERAMCKAMKIEPAKYAETKAAIARQSR